MRFLYLLLLILQQNWVSATTINLLPVADGHIADGGALGFSITTANNNVRTVSSGRDTRGIFEFDLSALPSSATILTVDLVLTLSGPTSNTASSALLEFFSIPGDGTITVADFSSPGVLQRSESFTLPAGTGTNYVLPLSDVAPFQAVVGTGNEIAIRADTVNFVTFRVHSLEAAVAPELMPNLQITYVPELSTGLLLLISLIPFVWRIRH